MIGTLGITAGSRRRSAAGNGPTVVQTKYAGTQITSITLDSAPAEGNTLILYLDDFSLSNPTPSSTNTTWTKVKQVVSGAAYRAWVGVVSGGAGGTVITLGGASGFLSAFVMEVPYELPGVMDLSSSGLQGTTVSTPSPPTEGSIVAILGGCDNTTETNGISSASQDTAGVLSGVVWGCIAIADGTSNISANMNLTGNGGTMMIIELLLVAPTVPTVVQTKYAGTTITSITLDSAPANGNSVIVYVDRASGVDPTSLSSTNTTWTKVKAVLNGTIYYSMWVGVVSGGAGGTVITLNGVSGFTSAFAMEIAHPLAATLGQSASGTQGTSVSTPSPPTAGNIVAIMGGCNSTVDTNGIAYSVQLVGVLSGIVWGCVRFADGTNNVTANMNLTGNAGLMMIAELP